MFTWYYCSYNFCDGCAFLGELGVISIRLICLGSMVAIVTSVVMTWDASISGPIEVFIMGKELC